MAMKWIEKCLPFPGDAPPNLRPPFLHDRGGAGGPQQLLGPQDDGQLAQPYTNEIWEYRAYTTDGYLAWKDPLTRVVSHADGIAVLNQMAAQSIGAQGPWGTIGKICGVYKTFYGAGARYCSNGGGAYAETTTPTWNGTFGCKPGWGISYATGGCVPVVSSYFYTSFVRRPNIPVINFRPPFSPVTFPVLIRPPFRMFLRGTKWQNGVVGQNEACDAYKTALSAAIAKRNAIKSVISDYDKAASDAAAAGNEEALATIAAARAGQVSALNAAQAQVNELQGLVNDCESQGAGGGGPPPPPPPQCSDSTPCPTGQECVSDVCLPICPAGQERKPDGTCGSKTTSGGGAGAGLGWLLGIGAAVGAIFLGLRAPKLPKQPARARRARRMRAGRRRAA